MKDFQLILASGSEGRRELLENLGLEFEVVVSQVDESGYRDLEVREMVQALALAKAREISDGRFQTSDVGKSNVNGQLSTVIIGADTAVVVGSGEVMGKPVDRKDAVRMMRIFSGDVHEVVSGIAVIDVGTGRQVVGLGISKVFVRGMCDEEIESYLDLDEWQGKAGGYQIQKSMSDYIDKIEGSMNAIVGLPLERLDKYLEWLGYDGVCGESAVNMRLFRRLYPLV